MLKRFLIDVLAGIYIVSFVLLFAIVGVFTLLGPIWLAQYSLWWLTLYTPMVLVMLASIGEST